MKRTFYFLLIIIASFSACTKVEEVPVSGTVTIDNSRYQSSTFYVFGFSFAQGKRVSTLEDPGPDIIIDVNSDNIPSRLTLQANNLNPSFAKVGDYADETSAKAAFDNLKTVSVTQWTDMADPITANQVWIYRSGDERYAKIRIVSAVNEIRQTIPYGECTLQWVFQPDGTLTFPGK